jgi:hypothetical protein
MNYFISFGEGDDNYKKALKRIIFQAQSLNVFKGITGYTSDDLRIHTSFWSKHSVFIEKNKRGYGYWLWKPYLILNKLQEINDGDVLLYCDCGCEIDIYKKNEIIHMLDQTRKNDIICGFASIEKEWTKRDLLHYFNMDNSDIVNENQFEATSICIKKCEKTLNFVKEWYEISCNYNLLDDSQSKIPNYENFKEHRHDQSIFSLLMKKYYYNYNKLLIIGNTIDLTRNRTGISKFFDWKKYISRYPDLQKAKINTKYRATRHWLDCGIDEGRAFY